MIHDHALCWGGGLPLRRIEALGVAASAGWPFSGREKGCRGAPGSLRWVRRRGCAGACPVSRPGPA
eukprot:2676241-Lingulodinium_polyedra.AAC.1